MELRFVVLIGVVVGVVGAMALEANVETAYADGAGYDHDEMVLKAMLEELERRSLPLLDSREAERQPPEKPKSIREVLLRQIATKLKDLDGTFARQPPQKPKGRDVEVERQPPQKPKGRDIEEEKQPPEKPKKPKSIREVLVRRVAMKLKDLDGAVARQPPQKPKGRAIEDKRQPPQKPKGLDIEVKRQPPQKPKGRDIEVERQPPEKPKSTREIRLRQVIKKLMGLNTADETESSAEAKSLVSELIKTAAER
ncbi:msx2-interacting protein-like [Ptychodera flava]|uniref:msx2-interacting protein-like n=1 Tax=Ptychodera flava TaxID=63121 RepID=UPI00396A3FD0